MSLTYLDLNAIDLERRIGHGTASVFKATMGGKAIAVKKMDCHSDEIPREVEVYNKLPPHPNILPLLGIAYDDDDDTILICMELADMSLYDYLHTKQMKPSLQQSIKWAIQIASGMHHIHQHGLAHRDLKSANVLLFEEADITKVCDFGSARPIERTATFRMAGTFRWMAPEFSDKESTKVNQLCDVFSYGMVLYEIFAQQLPFADLDDSVTVTSRIREGRRPSIPTQLPLYIKVLMHFCWQHSPNARPTFERILQVGPLHALPNLMHNKLRLRVLYLYNPLSPPSHQVLAASPTSQQEIQNILVSTNLYYYTLLYGQSAIVPHFI